MKKVLCVLLSVIMMLSGVSVIAMAAETEEDRYVVDELLLESVLDEESYYHLRYTRDNKYFDSTRALYSALNLYEDGIYNGITGSNDVKVATATMLGLVERVELAYNNEIMYTILEILGTTTDVADIIEKINDVIKVFDFVESDGWNSTFQVITELQVALAYSNELYEEYIDAVAEILTCKAAGQYYQDLLDHVADNCRSPYIRLAAMNLSDNIGAEIDKAFAAVAVKVGEDLAKKALDMAINELSSLNTVTAILSKIYSLIGDIAQFLFNTQEQYEYMTALATIVSIEDLLPEYVRDKVANTNEESGEFAFTSLLKLRESGESMLLNLGRVKRDSIAGSIFNGYYAPEIIERTATQVAKLDTIETIIEQEIQYPVSAIIATASPVSGTVYKADAAVLGTLSNEQNAFVYNDNGCFASVYDDIYGGYIKVAFIFNENCNTILYSADADCYMNLSYEAFTKGGFYDAFYFQDKFLNTSRDIRVDLNTWEAAPTYVIIDSVNGQYDRVMLTDYDSENEGLIYENDIDKGQVDKEEPKDEGVINGEGLWAVIANFFNDLFQQIKDFFNNLFK